MDNEKALLELLPDNIKFVSRDENGDLWATEESPKLTEENDKRMMEFYQPITLENTHSLSVFNHKFKSIDNMDILEVNV